MSNDYKDLGTTYVLFPFEPNWASPPSTTALMSRHIHTEPGTRSTLTALTEAAPYTFEAKFALTTKADEYTMLDFFNDQQGRVGRFWIRHPNEAFTLSATSLSGATALTCYANKTNLTYNGNERIYILMSNGDILTRKIAVTYLAATDRVQLALTTPLDRNVAPTGVVYIGRMLFARFDQDELTFDMHNTLLSELSMRFCELTNEYAEIV